MTTAAAAAATGIAFVGTISSIKPTKTLSITAEAWDSYTTPAITVPFPSLYGRQTQVAFTYQQPASWASSLIPSTFGGVAATSGLSSVMAAASADTLSASSSDKTTSSAFHWPTWATGVAAGGGAAVLLAFAAAVWLCVRRRKSKRNQALAARHRSSNNRGAYGEKLGGDESTALAGAGDYPPYPAATLVPGAGGKTAQFRGVPKTRQGDVGTDPYSGFGATGSGHARTGSDGTDFDDVPGYATPANGSAIDLTGSPARLFTGSHSDSPLRSGSPAPPGASAAATSPAGGKLPFSERTTMYAWGGLPAPRSSDDHSRTSHDRPRTPAVPAFAVSGYEPQPGARSPRPANRSSGLNPARQAEGRPSQERYDRSEAIPASPVLGEDDGAWSGHGQGLQPAWTGQDGPGYHPMDRGPGSAH